MRIGQARRPRRGRPRHRRPAGQGRPRPRRRPAHQHPAHRALPGRLRPGDAHRDVGAPRHPGERGDAAPPRRRRHRARRRAGSPAPTPARAGCPTPSEIFEVCRRVLARGVARRPTWPAATSWSPRAAPASRSTRCASSATAPPASRATRWPAPPSPAGARVTLVAANIALPDPAGVDVVRVGTAVQLREAVLKAAADADAVVMAAAVADFRPADVRRREDQEEGRPGARAGRPGPQPGHPGRDLRRPGPPRARWSSASPPRPDDVLDNGRAKLARKGCDLLVVNEVGEHKTFGSEDNEAVVLGADGSRDRRAARPEGSPGRRGLGPGGRAPAARCSPAASCTSRGIANLGRSGRGAPGPAPLGHEQNALAAGQRATFRVRRDTWDR